MNKESMRAIGKANQMRFKVRTNEFESSNCYFDVDSTRAYSYGWWRFVDIIDGKVVFNNYSYSPSTSKHQSKVRGLLSDLGIEVDICINARKGLQSLEVAISDYEYEIKQLVLAIQKPRSHKAKNKQRAEQIEFIQSQIETVKGLIEAQRKAA